MTRTRIRSLLLGAALVLGAAVVTWQGWRYAHQTHPALAGVSALPDLSRWPAQFRQELEAASAQVRQAPDPTAALGKLASLYFANDLLPEAEQALRVLQRVEPKNPRWPYLLGVLLSRGNEPAHAEPLFRETLRLAPDYSPARFQLGQLLANGTRDDEARSFYEERLAKEPGDVLATLGLVDIERQQGQTAPAIRRLEDLLRIKPAAAEARLLLAEILDSVGRNEEAAEHRLIMQNTGVATPVNDPWLDELYIFSFDPFRLQTLGQMRLNAQKVDQALPYLRKAAELAPADPEIQDLFAQALRATGQTKQAESALRTALQRTGGAPILWLQLSKVLAQDNPAESEALLREALAAHPSSAELQNALGQHLYHTRRFEAAITSFEAALRLNPVMTEAQLNLGRALGASGRRGEAREAIAKAIEMRPAGVDAILLLARLEFEEGRLEEAETLAARVLTLDPQSSVAQPLYEQLVQRRATAVAAAGNLPQAEAIYQASLKVAPNLGALHGNFGAFLAKQSRFGEATGYFRNYVELAPNDARAWLFLGTTLKQTGNQKEAKAVLGRGLAVARAGGDARRAALIEEALQR